MKHSNYSRRGFLASVSSVIGGLLVYRSANARALTPRTTEGPFYPRPSMRFADVDNDLVKVEGAVREAGGEIIHLKGVLTDKQGRPLAGHRVEIWQCDVNGKYLHTGDRQSTAYDQGFQGFGHDITDANGAYQFRTIKPTQYPGRTPHIHVKVLSAERELLTTQFYIKDHPNNARDGLFNWMSAEEQEVVSMGFRKGESGIETSVNIIV
ncbi:protocatechuate 3,4-dioxygenase [Leucothrix pacifica]|uniref:Protocatechuate 3,4-dioxygenase n=1 Tax=Leucothrix pacifica TaxID=1247513 RepID=A0A317CEQ4_9GAMM|nr:protocatechuate 3,4-dioxygenase [Leucothrix pacifica]PWQ96571.1 protocatechuate 3,4-dioxygenase [Leucothrix pacifica]